MRNKCCPTCVCAAFASRHARRGAHTSAAAQSRPDGKRTICAAARFDDIDASNAAAAAADAKVDARRPQDLSEAPAARRQDVVAGADRRRIDAESHRQAYRAARSASAAATGG
jgi:hypothetical protein